MPKSKEAHVLVRLRRHLSLSQEQLAKWCDCSYYTIQAVELGRLNLSNSLAERISMATGAPVKWLLENNLSAPLPKLFEGPPAKPGVFNNSFTSRTLLFVAVVRALRAIESAKGGEQLQLVNHYSLKFREELDKAFGESEIAETHEGLADYIQPRLDTYRNPSAEERKHLEESHDYLLSYLVAHFTSLNAEVSARQEKKGKKQSARPQKKAPRRIRQSA
jgi:DNA-binding XRE family transcriptional regulator